MLYVSLFLDIVISESEQLKPTDAWVASHIIFYLVLKYMSESDTKFVINYSCSAQH